MQRTKYYFRQVKVNYLSRPLKHYWDDVIGYETKAVMVIHM